MNKNTQIKEFRLKLYPQDFYAVRAFYESELGCAIVNEWDRADSKGVMFDVGGTILEILTPEKLYAPIAGADVSLEVDDVWALHETMASKPYVIRGLRDNAWGDTSFCIADPEGFEITFFTKSR
ncbi:MAG: VOC family protein [Candidatus Saccharimonas sp.]